MQICRVVVLATVAIASAGAGCEPTGPPSAETMVNRLAAAVDGHRLWAPRLTGGFPHAPCGPPDPDPFVVCAVGPPDDLLANPDLDEVGRWLDSNDLRAAPSRHLLARWNLVFSDLEHTVDAAIGILEELASEESDPDVAADLAAALLVQARAQDRPALAVRALGHVERVLSAEPSHTVALFNRAVGLQFLGFYRAAIGAWRDAAAATHDFDWRDEATANADRLENAVAVRAADPAPTARLDEAIERFLAVWPVAADRGDERAMTRAEREVHYAGEHLADAALDSLLSDTYDAARAARLAGARRLVGFSAAVGSLRRGIDAYRSLDYRSARRELGRLEPAAGTTIEVLGNFYSGLVAYQELRYPAALDRLNRVATRGSRFPLLAGRAHRAIGLVHLFQRDLASAKRSYLAARESFDRARDEQGTAAANTDLAWYYSEVGDDESAWKHRHAALRASAAVQDPRLRSAVFVEIMHKTGSATLDALAVDERVIAARGIDRPAGLVGALLLRASIGDAVQAAADLAEAERLLAEETPTAQVTVRGVLEFVRARLTLPTDPQRAVAHSKLAADALLEANDARLLREALLLQARSQFAAGAPESEIESTLAEAIARLEREHGRIRDTVDARHAIEMSRPTFEMMVQVKQRLSQHVAALSYAERSRAPWIGTSPVSEELIRSVRARLARDDAAALVYFTAPEGAYAWGIAPGREIEHFVIPARRDNLARLADRYLRGLRNGSEVARESRQLYELLIAPFSSALLHHASVFIVADGPIERIPFAALLDPTSGKQLVDRGVFAKAPGLRWIIDRTEVSRPTRAAPPRVLFLGGAPIVENTGGGRLTNLGTELERIREQWSDMAITTRTRATPEDLELAADHDVLHYAGHAFAGAEPRLILSSQRVRDASAAVSVSRIRELDLRSTSLVILSGCSTAASDAGAVQSVNNLARAFLEAGVSTVIASRWTVDDAGAADLMGRVHANLAAGHAPGEALRRAQIEGRGVAGSSLSDPFIWAAFEIVGAPGYPINRPGGPR